MEMTGRITLLPKCRTLEEFIHIFCEYKPKPYRIPTAPYGLAPEETPEGDGTIFMGSCRRVDTISDGCCDGYVTGTKLPDGFEEIEEFGYSPYRFVWANDSLRAIVTYCEGDISVTIDPTETLYRGRLASAKAFYATHA
jgi:hypothetical protein